MAGMCNRKRFCEFLISHGINSYKPPFRSAHKKLIGIGLCYDINSNVKQPINGCLKKFLCGLLI